MFLKSGTGVIVLGDGVCRVVVAGRFGWRMTAILQICRGMQSLYGIDALLFPETGSDVFRDANILRNLVVMDGIFK